MKKIGYVYRYNENEKKGILVYGYNTNVYNPKYNPIKFSASNCNSTIKTGQLVYFDCNDNTASNIERASLLNFRRDVLSNIVLSFDTYGYEEGIQRKYIRFENLQNATFFPDDKRGSEVSFFDDDFELPENIDELFALFGNCIQFSFMNSEFLTVDILDIAYWIDRDIVESHSFYGTTTEQILDLFNLFVGKEREAYTKYSSKEYDKSISPNWKHLLSPLNHDELMEICKNEPMLQPAMPEDFCMEHLNILSFEYGFPSVAVCDAFCRSQIKRVESTTEYLFLKDQLNSYIRYTNDKTKDYGVQLCEMGDEIVELLEIQYKNVVLDNICRKLTSISNGNNNWKERILFLLKENAKYLLKLGLTIDKYYNMLIKRDPDSIYFFFEDYNALLEEDREPFKTPISDWGKEYLTQIANSKYYLNKAWEINCGLSSLSDFLTEAFVNEIRDIVNPEFAELDDFSELKYAYEGNLISEEQYLERYKSLTKDFTLQQLVQEITAIRNFSNEIPLSLQNYLVREIFNKFDFKNMRSYKYVKTANGGISNFEGLVKWLNLQSNLDSKLVDEIVKEMKEIIDK